MSADLALVLLFAGGGDRDVRDQPAAHGRCGPDHDRHAAADRRHHHGGGARGLQRQQHRPDRGPVRDRRGPGAYGRGPAARRLAELQGGQQRDPPAGPADGGGRRARRHHELDRRGRDLHSGGPAHRAEHRHRAEPADDAAELRGADQRHADPGRHGAEPRGQRRAGPPGRGGIPLLQLHALRPAGADPRHRLHAVRAALAGRDDRHERSGTAAPAPARVDRAVPARRPGVPGARDIRLAARGQAARGAVAARGRRERSGDRAQPQIRHRPDPPDGTDAAAGRRHPGPRRPGAGRRDRGAAARVRARRQAARRGRSVLHRPLAGDRHGRGHRPGRIEAGRPDRASSRGALGIRADGDRPAPRAGGARARPARRDVEDRRHAAPRRLLDGHQASPDRTHGPGGAELAGRAGGGSSGCEQGATSAGRASRSSSG